MGGDFSEAVRERGRRLPREKAIATLVLAAGFFLPYLAIQRLGPRAERLLPETWLDRAIPFLPGWVFAYLSIYLVVGAAPWLAGDRDGLRRFVRGALAVCAVAFVVFLAWPTVGPRSAAACDLVAYRLLTTCDGPSNAFPSLHAGLAAYAFLGAGRLLGPLARGRARLPLALLAAAWTAAILFATIATRQHRALDLPAGLLLAWAGHAWTWRGAPEAAPYSVPRARPCTPERAASSRKEP